MKFEIAKDDFLKSIQKVQAVVERKNTVPLLSNVRIKADSGILEINATDLEVGIRDILDAGIKESGSITVSAKKLYEVLKELPEDTVLFEVADNNWIHISCGMAVFKLVGMPDEDYPNLPVFDTEKLISIPIDVLDTLTRKTVYAVSHDENRHVLNGVKFTITADRILMVATDGHRLSFVDMPNQTGLQEMDIIVPQKGIRELQRMIGEGVEEIYFGVMENHIVFQAGKETVLTRLVDGKFPDYTKVIPETTQTEILIDKESLYNSLRRVSLFSDVKVRGVKLEFADNSIQVTASTPEYGEAKDQISVDYTGDLFTVGFNVNYLLDLLRTIDTETIKICLNDTSGPAVFEPTGQEDYHYIAIVMPMII
ncbi:DNA polymerase III subunit beta [bacterium]|nr:DNA polymerase III subunit beta [candidate division CSSED10-310 bacterium]